MGFPDVPGALAVDVISDTVSARPGARQRASSGRGRAPDRRSCAPQVCPWCYIGKRRLEKAMAHFPVRRPHPLACRADCAQAGQPDLPGPRAGAEVPGQVAPLPAQPAGQRDGDHQAGVLQRQVRRGARQGHDPLHDGTRGPTPRSRPPAAPVPEPAAVQEVFHAEGIQNSFTGKTGNSFNSHRLIALAGRQGPQVQDALINALFKAYFEEVRCWSRSCLLCAGSCQAHLPPGSQAAAHMRPLLPQGKFINDPEVLLEAAQQAGLESAEKAVRDPEEGREQVSAGGPEACTCIRACSCEPTGCTQPCRASTSHAAGRRCSRSWSAAARSALAGAASAACPTSSSRWASACRPGTSLLHPHVQRASECGAVAAGRRQPPDGRLLPRASTTSAGPRRPTRWCRSLASSPRSTSLGLQPPERFFHRPLGASLVPSHARLSGCTACCTITWTERFLVSRLQVSGKPLIKLAAEKQHRRPQPCCRLTASVRLLDRADTPSMMAALSASTSLPPNLAENLSGCHRSCSARSRFFLASGLCGSPGAHACSEALPPSPAWWWWAAGLLRSNGQTWSRAPCSTAGRRTWAPQSSTSSSRCASSGCTGKGMSPRPAGIAWDTKVPHRTS